MNITSCPNCGGRVRSESIGWKCEKCGGFIDMRGMTTKGWKEEDFIKCADKIAEIIKNMKTE